MNNINNKKLLYQLMDLLISRKIDEKTFCDEFYCLYNLNLDLLGLAEQEYLAFSELDKIVSRFSEYEEDHKLDAQAFTTKEEVRKKIIETKEKLNKKN